MYPRLNGLEVMLRGLVMSVVLGVAATTSAFAEEPTAKEEEEHGPVHIAHAPGGLVVLTVDAETQARMGLRVQAVETASWQPQLTAYGRLELDPAQSFTLRAPIAGFLRASLEQSWPGIGTRVESGAMLGSVEPRLTPLEWVDLRGRWMDAQAEVEEIKAELDAARASLEHKSRLNTEDRLVSDRTVEEARARFTSGDARLEAARQKTEMLAQILAGRSATNAPFPLQAFTEGEVAEVLARPGEVVDAGQPLLTIARYDVMIARVALPLGQQTDFPLPLSVVAVSGEVGGVLSGVPIGGASRSDPLTMGQGLLFRVSASGDPSIRPGTPVVAYIPTSRASADGVLIPRSAVLRHAGKTWAYVQSGADRFERRDVVLQGPTAEGWFAADCVTAHENIVIAAAQLLLSEELKAEIESEEQAEE